MQEATITSPTSLATVTDVQARTQIPLTTEQQARAAVLISDASAIVRARVSDPPPATAPRVAAREGGGLYLTDDEVELLRPPAAPPRGRVLHLDGLGAGSHRSRNVITGRERS